MILDTSKYLGACACGHEHTLRTKLVVCEHGALKNFDRYMEDAGLSGFRTVIYDTNTYNLPSITHVQADQEIVLEMNDNGTVSFSTVEGETTTIKYFEAVAD